MPPAKKPKPPKLSAFISHAKADAKKAQEIAASLEERGLQCWIAPRDVKAGRAYGDEIIRGIESAKAFVLVLSKASNGSDFVAREVERAVSKQKPIFVVRLANVEPAPALELFISGTQWIDAFPGRLGPHIGRLAKLLGEEGDAEPVDLGGGKDDPKPKPPRWIWPAAAAAVALIAVGGSDGALAGADAVACRRSRPRAGLADQAGVARKSGNLRAGADRGSAARYKDDRRRQAGGRGRRLCLQARARRARGGKGRFCHGDPDFRACEKLPGKDGIAACDRAIASGKFSRPRLSYLYSDRGFCDAARAISTRHLPISTRRPRSIPPISMPIGIAARSMPAKWRLRPRPGRLHQGARPQSRHGVEGEDRGSAECHRSQRQRGEG